MVCDYTINDYLKDKEQLQEEYYNRLNELSNKVLNNVTTYCKGDVVRIISKNIFYKLTTDAYIYNDKITYSAEILNSNLESFRNTLSGIPIFTRIYHENIEIVNLKAIK